MEEIPMTSYRKPVFIIRQLVKRLSVRVVVQIDYARNSPLLKHKGTRMG